MALFKESFPWRVEAVKDENTEDSETYRIMVENVNDLEYCSSKRDFWYSEHEYICVGTKAREED